MYVDYNLLETPNFVKVANQLDDIYPGVSEGLQGIGDVTDTVTPLLWVSAARSLAQQLDEPRFAGLATHPLRNVVAARVARAIAALEGLDEWVS